jgi:hypothetical protein
MSVVGKTCPFCQTPVKTGQEAITGDNCGISHHAECWRENHGRTTYDYRLPGASGNIVAKERANW